MKVPQTFSSRVDFLRNVDPLLAEHLVRAAQLLHDDPASAAVALRCFVERLVRHHLATSQRSQPLYDEAQALLSRQIIDQAVYDDIDGLRRIGNRGAHPEQHGTQQLTASDLVAELRRGWKLAEWIHVRAGGKVEDVPMFAPPSPAEGNSIFRDAVLGGEDGRGDPFAKFHVAKAIRAQDKQRLVELHEGKHPFVSLRTAEVVELLRQADYWIPAARTELAECLLEKHGRTDEEREEALELLSQAAADDEPDALFLLGLFHLEGYHGVPIDLAKAVSLFERGIVHEDPRSLNALAYLHSSAHGVPLDAPLARHYAERSAKAGFPIGQHLYSCFLFDGVGGDVDPDAALSWLRRAVRQNWPPAEFDLARRIFNGDVSPAVGEDPVGLLDAACSSGHSDALCWRASQELEKSDDDVDFYAVIKDLRRASEGEGRGGAEGDAILRERQRVLARLERYLRRLPMSERRFDLAFLWNQFNRDGTAKYASPTDLAKALFNYKDNGLDRPEECVERVIRAGTPPGQSEVETQQQIMRARLLMRAQASKPVAKVGRNERCPCGSGRKYKRCHGA